MRAEAAERSNLVSGPLCLILIFDPGGTKRSVFLPGREDAKARVLDEDPTPVLEEGKEKPGVPDTNRIPDANTPPQGHHTVDHVSKGPFPGTPGYRCGFSHRQRGEGGVWKVDGAKESPVQTEVRLLLLYTWPFGLALLPAVLLDTREEV